MAHELPKWLRVGDTRRTAAMVSVEDGLIVADCRGAPGDYHNAGRVAAEIARRWNAFEAMEKALRYAEKFAQAELDCRARSYCAHDAEGRPDYSTLDDGDASDLAEAMQAVEMIGAALSRIDAEDA
jgi:hypothetical protein